jgi:hypothetical protein
VLLALALVSMLGAAALRSALQTPPAPATPRIVVTAQLSRVLLDPLPIGVIEVVVENRDATTTSVATIEASGSGIRQVVSTRIEQGVGPQDVARFSVRVPLECGQLVDDIGPPSVRVGVRPAGADPTASATFAQAVPTGPEMAAGLCPTALEQLPEGWHTRLQLRSFTDAGTTAGVSFSGLPDRTTQILFVRADDFAPVVTSSTRPDAGGVASVTMLRPVPDCTAPSSRRTLPTGLQLMVNGSPAGPQLVYLPVGPGLARWLLAAWDVACPGPPPGAPSPAPAPALAPAPAPSAAVPPPTPSGASS